MIPVFLELDVPAGTTPLEINGPNSQRGGRQLTRGSWWSECTGVAGRNKKNRSDHHQEKGRI